MQLHWGDLLKLGHPTANGVFQEEPHSFSSTEEKEVLQSRASPRHRQGDGARRLLSPSGGGREEEQPRTILQSGVPGSGGAVCQDSAQGGSCKKKVQVTYFRLGLPSSELSLLSFGSVGIERAVI